MDTIQQCDSKWYYIFVQDYVTARDLKDGMPKLQGRMAGAAKSSLVEIPEVVPSGELSAESIVSRLEKACEAKGKNNKACKSRTGSVFRKAYELTTSCCAVWPEKDDEYQVAIMEMPALPSGREARAKTLADTGKPPPQAAGLPHSTLSNIVLDNAMDDTVASVLSPKDASAVFIYITTPPPSEGATDQNGNVYEMDEPYPAVLQTDLKRDTGLHSRQSDDDNMQDGLPLFEKYQFLSPREFALIRCYIGCG